MICLKKINVYQFVGRVAWTGPDLPCRGRELGPTGSAVVVVGMVNLTAEAKWFAVDYRAATERLGVTKIHLKCCGQCDQIGRFLKVLGNKFAVY